MSLMQTIFSKRNTAGRRGSSGRHADSSGKRLSALVEFGTRFNGTDDLLPAIEQTLRAAVRELDADLGYIMLLDPTQSMLLTEVAISIGEERDFPQARSLGEGPEGQVAGSCVPLSIAKGSMPYGGIGTFDFAGEALICVPLIKHRKEGGDNHAYGTLTIIRERRKRVFRPADEEIARSLAALATVTVANAAQYRTLRSSFIASLQAMARAVEAKVPFMEGHGERVGEVCRAIGERLQMDADVLDDLRDGALLHEIGKVGVPDTILLKPGQLTPEEFVTLKHYPEIGYDICKPLGLGEQVLMLIRNHPERLDGTGYPDKLKYGELPLPLRILCVADAFDAMSSYRPYRQVMDIKARQEQLNRFAGTQFDPIVVETLKGLLADGKLESLYQEHWAKYAEKSDMPAALPEAAAAGLTIIDHTPAESQSASAAPIASREPAEPAMIYLADLADDVPAPIASPILAEATEPHAARITLNGEIVDETIFAAGIPAERKLTLEEAAMEAAAFAADALEAANREDKAA